MNRSFPMPVVYALLLSGLLAACSAAPDAGSTASSDSEIMVTTAMPVQRIFHDTVEAFGSAMGDPHSARTISLAHGGQIVAVNGGKTAA